MCPTSVRFLCNSPKVSNVFIQSRWDSFYNHARAMCIFDLFRVYALALRLVHLWRVWYISCRPAGRTLPIPSALLPCLSVPPPLPSPPLHSTTFYCRLTPTLFAPLCPPTPSSPPQPSGSLHRTSSQTNYVPCCAVSFCLGHRFLFSDAFELAVMISFARSL